MRPDFQARFSSGDAQILSRVLPADLETPVSAALKLTLDARHSFLLESVEGGAVRGRYSLLGWAPDLLWRCRDGVAEVANPSFAEDITFTAQTAAPLDSLREELEGARLSHLGGLPAATAGLVGYLGYDMIRLVETLDARAPAYLDAPDSLLMRPTMMAIFDTVKDELTLATVVRPTSEVSAEQAFTQAMERLDGAETQLAGPVPLQKEQTALTPEMFDAPPSNTSPPRYKSMVAQAKEYIAAGDIFQVVLSQRFSMPFDLSALSLYRALRRTNPAPFLFLLRFDGLDLIGSSPEILVRVRDGEVTVRPIAGTRPRGKTDEEDAANAQDLLADKKELAEHLMLLDLGRNDVGRVALPGSVRVTQRNTIERYSHVMHIVSNVVGDINPEKDAISALFAGFPAGTVSGAPKIRAMEIIDELEADGRGPYAGAVGYFAVDGSMDSCIVLRTAVLQNGQLHVQAGAGIVADSDPDMEQAECIHKSGALIAAARLAVDMARG